MEESSYVPNSIPPALVVFSQAGYGDAIRMQRSTFGSQGSDGKELNLSSLSPSSFGLRPMDSYGGLSAQLVHLQNPFLHPALEARLPFGTAGAFRPVGTSTPSSTSSDDRMNVKNLPSAFTTPNLSNRRKLDAIVEGVIEQHQQQQSNRSRSDGNSFVTPSVSGVINLDKSSPSVNSSNYMNGGHQSRHRSCSPVNCSPNTREKQEDRDRQDEYPGEERDRDGNATPNSDMTDRSTPEDAHINKRRRKVGDFTCPVCKMSLHPIDLESHLLNEVEQLICISQIRRQQQLRGEPLASSSRDSPNAIIKKEGAIELSQDSRWDTYQRVRNNRHSRLRLKTKRRREESGGSGPTHPQVNFSVCRMPLHGSNDQLSSHLDPCMRKNGDIADEDDEPVDIEGDGDGDSRDVSEYEWNNGHRRLSKSSHHHAPMTAINMTTSKRRDEDNDMEVVVDGDDGGAYGYSQYTEADIQTALKSPESSSSSPSREHDLNHSKENNWIDDESSNDGAKTGPPNDNINLRMVIQALRTRIRELEKEAHSGGLPNDGNHCLVCMDGYRKPVVSISCWHVHCEKCWLRSLGTKKLCPQCNMITSTSDLRRIFL